MIEKPDNILLIVLDSLRYDRLSCYGYEKNLTPFLDSIADEGLKFEKAYSTAPWTVPVHGSLFTGMLPSYHGSHRKTKSFKQPSGVSLAGRLSKEDYQTAGFSTNPWISPEFDFDTGFDHFESLTTEPPFSEEPTSPEDETGDLASIKTLLDILSWSFQGNPVKRISNGIWKKFLKKAYVDGKDVNKAIFDWIDESDISNKFIFVNYMDVHDPHCGDFLFDKATFTNIDFRGRPDDPEKGKRLYDQSVSKLDKILKDLFAGLDERIDLSNTLTVILGDHGECMGEHGYWGHGTYLYEELLHVPLLIQPHTSNLDGVGTDQPVSLIELYQSILEIAQARMGEDESDSYNLFRTQDSLFAECTGPRPNMEEASNEGYRAVIQDGWKLIRNKDTDETEIMKIWGSQNLDIDESIRKKRLENLEEKRWEEQGFEHKEESSSLDEDTQDRLSDLGYL